jgi:hypothetical protein
LNQYKNSKDIIKFIFNIIILLYWLLFTWIHYKLIFIIENLLIITLNLGHDMWCLCVQQFKKTIEDDDEPKSYDAPPSSLLNSRWVYTSQTTELFRAWGTFPALSTGRGKGACWGSGIRLGKGTSYLVIRSCIQNQPTSWLELILHLFNVRTSHGQLWTHLSHHGLTWGKPPPSPI